jgi:hypothetical protein
VSGTFDPGSFRDRHARIFSRNDDIYRGLSQAAHDAWRQLSATSFFDRFTKSGGLVGTREVPLPSVPQADGWAAVLQHDRIPFISYPYEWSFGMLKDAALLQLDLVLAAIDEGMILKDGSAYNVQWRGAGPVFIDVSSFWPLRPGEPWAGYLQFCQLCLYPLLLQAYKDVPFHPWLRGSLEGISPSACDAMMSARDHLRPGVLLHVHMQARAQASMAGTSRDVRRDLQRAGFNAALIRANAARLRALVAGLAWNASTSTWSDYADTHSYGDADAAAKVEFVRAAAAAAPRRLVWDLGANVGVFSRIAADQGAYVVAIDGDHLTVERLYRRLAEAGDRRILPLVMDLSDPSPGLGWRHAERAVIEGRGRPDLVLALALVHHMVISANVPLEEWMAWVTGLAREVVVEFVGKDDPMTERLLRNKDDQYREYTRESFERLLASHMDIRATLPLQGGSRVLYHAMRRDAS